MDLVIGVVGMVVLAGIYVALGLADRGEDGCEGCLLRGDLEGGCLGCPELREPGVTRSSSSEPAATAAGAARTNGDGKARPLEGRGRNG